MLGTVLSTSYGIISFKHHPAFEGRRDSFRDRALGLRESSCPASQGWEARGWLPASVSHQPWRELERDQQQQKKSV